MLKQLILCFSIFFAYKNNIISQNLVVAADGSGDFKTIQSAIESLPDSSKQQRIIFIKQGIYREKIFIAKSNIRLKGEKNPHFGKDWKTLQTAQNAVTEGGGVLIIFSEAREIFRCNHPDDWGAATMNIRANDIQLENLLIVNDFGFAAKGDSTFICNGKAKVTRPNGHQFALRCMPTTQRLTVKNCNFHALGGDTVSPWDVDNGTFQFFDCTMEGDVDFYCPRGWAYAEHCFFICHNRNAAIWHDGTGNEDAKTVLKNCKFVGDKGFKLGRFHRDAQFYLIDCTFSSDMADAEIYQVRKDTNLVWGKRVFYYNCHGEKQDFAWHQNNIDKKLAKKINRDWTLKSRWSLSMQPIKNKSDYALPKVADAPISENTTSNNMITAQRNIGGWAKTLDGKTQPPPYDQTWDATQTASIADDAGRNDATIDNNATTREILFLAKTFDENSNPKYKIAAEKGIEYLLKMQYDNGGFPQFFPDTSGYRKHITFNDNAMINVLELLQAVAQAKTPFEKVGNEQRERAKKAVAKGINCILETQIRVNGRATIWCAQHHYKNLAPVKARSFELPSFSGSESVGILRFLMQLDNPTPSVIAAVRNGVTFLDHLKIKNLSVERVKDEKQATKTELLIKNDSNSSPLWARFYDLDSQKPFFCGRDGIKKENIFEIENERRVHYAWYGTWATKLIEKDFPKWVKKWVQPSRKGITNERDTSYNNQKALNDARKINPTATLVSEAIPPSVSVERNIIFQQLPENQLLKLDVFYPSKKAEKKEKLRTVILIIHGGGWRSGSKEQHHALAQRLASLGYVCFTPEYRLSTHALFPAAVHDLKAAIRWIRKNANTYQIDNEKIAVMGFSAGGELAAFLATTGAQKKWDGAQANQPQNISSKVNALIDLDGTLSFVHPESGEGDDSKKISAATHWLGYSKLENPELWREASPLTHLSANTPPTLFINSNVARMHAGQTDFVNFLKKQHIYTEIHTFSDAPHSFVQFQPWFDPMVKFIDDFLKKVF